MKKNKNKKDWFELVFVELYALFVLLASVLGFFYAEWLGVEPCFILPLTWWLKLIFVSLIVFCGWLIFWLPRKWFIH